MSLFDAFKSKPVPEGTTREYKGLGGFFSLMFSHLTQLMGVNLLYLLLCLPVITAPAANTGMTLVSDNIRQDKFRSVWQEFWRIFKSEFKKSTLFGLCWTAAFAVSGTGVYIYWTMLEQHLLLIIPMALVLAICFALAAVQPYAYLLIAIVDLRLKDIIKNSFLLASIGGKRTLLLMLVYIAVGGAMLLLFPFSVPVGLLLGFSLMNFAADYICYPVVKQYVIDPYYNKSENDKKM